MSSLWLLVPFGIVFLVGASLGLLVGGLNQASARRDEFGAVYDLERARRALRDPAA